MNKLTISQTPPLKITLLLFCLFFLVYYPVQAKNNNEFSSLQEASDKLTLSQSTLNVYVAGKNITLPILINIQTKDKYVSLDSKESRELFKNLETTVKIKKYRITFRGNISTTSIENNTLISDGSRIPLNNDFFFIRNEPFIHLQHLPSLAKCNVAINGDTVYIDPILIGIESTVYKKEFSVKIISSATQSYSISSLKNPGRTVIDIANLQCQKSQGKKEFDSKIGKITFAQNKTFPNYVRIVIPTGTQYALSGRRSKRNELLLFFKEKPYAPSITAAPTVRLSHPTPVPLSQSTPSATVSAPPRKPLIPITSPAPAPVQTVRTESISSGRVYTPPPGSTFIKVSNPEISCIDSNTLITLTTTAPVNYKLYRFPHPDNRFVVDIQDSVLDGRKQELTIDSPHSDKIKLAQFQPAPCPVVRLVVNLKNNFDLKIDNKSSQNKIIISINDKIISTAGSARTQPKLYPPPTKIICLDPGHGGYDSGAVNRKYNVTEKELTLKIGMRLAEILRQRNWSVSMTRTSDRDVSYWGSSDNEELSARVQASDNANAGIFISIHCDASSNADVKGVSTHWYKPQDELLAQYIQDELVARLPTKNRGARKSNFYLLKMSAMPAVLIETGFITNEEDFSYLSDTGGIEKIATGIADAIENYFKLFNL